MDSFLPSLGIAADYGIFAIPCRSTKYEVRSTNWKEFVLRTSYFVLQKNIIKTKKRNDGL